MISKRLERLIFIFNFIIYCTCTYAQVVNIEKQRKGNEDGFAGVISLGFNIIDNGKNILQTQNGIDLQYKKKAHTLILLNDLSLMQVDGDNLVNSGFQHLRYNFTIKDSSFLTIEAFGQHQYNSIQLLEQRFLLGGGPRFRLLNSKKMLCYVATLGMYEYEQRSDSLRNKTELARLASYISLDWGILDNLEFKNITYYQPAFTDFMHYRIASETSLGLKITDALSFKIALQTTYDSHPPEGVQELFYTWQNSLKYEF